MKKINVNQEVRRIIDNNLAIRKLLGEGLINTLALARKILKDYKLDCTLSAVLSAVRRYQEKLHYEDYLKGVYAALKNATLTTRTKLFSILIRKRAEVRKKVAKLYSELEPEETLVVFETTKYLKIILDKERKKDVKDLFSEKEIIDTEADIGILHVSYGIDVTKIPGVFALIANELGANGVSIVDSMICHLEHIIVVREKDIQKAFNVIFNLLHKKYK